MYILWTCVYRHGRYDIRKAGTADVPVPTAAVSYSLRTLTYCTGYARPRDPFYFPWSHVWCREISNAAARIMRRHPRHHGRWVIMVALLVIKGLHMRFSSVPYWVVEYSNPLRFGYLIQWPCGQPSLSCWFWLWWHRCHENRCPRLKRRQLWR